MSTEKYSYKIILSYKGTNYSGWQFQTVNPETVQNYVQKVLANIVNHQEFQVIGASRTDTGVHASGQVLKVTLPKKILPEKLLLGMNTKLPNDIRVLDCEFIANDFNVNRDCVSKEYNYYFSPRKDQSAALSEIVYYTNEELNIKLMHKACDELIGTHDFTKFCVKGSREVQISRKITHCSIEKTSFGVFDNEVFYLKIQASGFLKYMIRFIMGALLQVAKEELTIDEFKDLLANENSNNAKRKAPPHGLHLMKINY